MKAVQYRTFGQPPEVVEIETPSPNPGEVLLRVTASGLCHSDIFVMDLPEAKFAFGPLPLTLGHEGVGIVTEIGAGVKHVKMGQSVAVYGSWGCGVCVRCASGHENYCERSTELGILTPGLGAPGSMAEYMIVDDERHLVDIGSLDPASAAPLTDAALTSYHAIKPCLGHLGANSTAVVIGIGGLGHVGIQILKALSGAYLIALDIDERKLALALELGADEAMLVSDPRVPRLVRDLTNQRMANCVFDFAGFQESLDLAKRLVAIGGALRVIGLGKGRTTVPVGYFDFPLEATFGVSYWGYRQELFEVIDMAKRGIINVHVERFSINDAPMAYEYLRKGSLKARAVVVM